MSLEQIVALSLIGFALVMFVWGRLRYDMVALTTLLIGVVVGTVPSEVAFEGFGHPAVITVIAVLVISRALSNSGIVAALSRIIRPAQKYATAQIMLLGIVVGALSAFMNNVGALALMLPVALQQASITGRSPSFLLMPLSFGSLLGGLTTLIGTPPNIIIATYRTEVLGEPFRMFDFFPVGGGIALVGILFVTLVGWRFLPARKDPRAANENMFELKGYIVEAQITEDSTLVGKLIREFEELTDGSVVVVSLLRGDRTIHAPSGFAPLKAGDIVLVEGDPGSLKTLAREGDLEIGSQEATALDTENIRDENIEVIEAVVPPGARLEGSTARSMRLRNRYGVNLLAVAHQGRTIMDRLGSLRFAAGDVLLLQGEPLALKEALAGLGCLPLATRDLQLDQHATVWPMVIFAGAITLSAAGILPIQISFMLAVVVIVMTGFLSIRELYEAIEWPIVILLASMIPIGEALQTTGATQVIAQQILDHASLMTPTVLLGALIILTMLLSDVINNAVTAVIMAPIGVGLAQGLGVNVDAFLMAVAVGSSCTFLTPIGHQSNTLVMAPGGYRFSDYARMGLPLNFLIVATAVPLIEHFWPLEQVLHLSPVLPLN